MAAAQSSSPQGSSTEYRVKLGKSIDKNWHVMRFKPPHKCDLETLTNPTLDRKAVKRQDGNPEEGEGSEFGKKRREEVRKRKRGYDIRRANPDDQPWVLKERKREGKHFVGRKEGTVNSSSSYYILTVSEDKAFEAYPIESWYDFIPPVKYNFLNEEEAEAQFEKRNKTLNYFSVMVSKRLRDQEGVGDDKTHLGAEGKRVSKKKSKSSGELMLTDSESDAVSSDASGNEGGGRTKSRKKVLSKNKGAFEGGEETDEGDMESWEVDYMSDASSVSEKDYKAKEAIKEVPKDDEEVERAEEGDIDKGFSESSSEDELTEEGKELNALIKKQSGQTESEKEDDEIDIEKPFDKDPVIVSPKTSREDSSLKGVKRERERQSDTSSNAPSASPQPPPKKPKKEFSLSTITDEEVKHYLSRRPITSKDLVRKFTSKKSDMDKKKIVDQLHQIIQNLKNVEKQTIKGKLYLSLKQPPS
ncbi:general transcription factor IIF subunit 1-like [Halichondria panicea]|uniref:general transcription factor IIF subunit 1-like n=1 Tax=Halichondria panicea TaxID=6063 RepID=UPI00312B2CA4